MPKKNNEIKPVIEEIVEPEQQIETEEIQPEKVKSKVKQKINFKLMLLLTVIIASFTGALAGGFYVYFTGLSALNQGSAAAEPTPVSVPTSVPKSSPEVVEGTPEPEVSVNVGDYDVQVLNGSGKIGEASKAEKILEAGDFKVVGVGNAANYNYKQTVIQYKENVSKTAVEDLRGLLSKVYDVSSEDGSLAASSKYDIVVIVGSN